MGGNSSKSTVEQIIDQKFINRSTLDSFNEQVTKSTTENLMKSLTQAGASASQNANIRIGEISATGPGSTVTNINASVGQEAYVDLQVADKSIQQNDINTELALAIINNVSQSINNEQMAKLVSNSEAEQKVSGLSFTGGNETESNVYNRMNSLNLNETSRKFTNIVTNVINQKAQTENVKQCIATDFKNASIDIGKISATDGGTVSNVGLTINQASKVISKCIFETQMTSKVTNAIAQAVGLTVKDENTNKQSGEGDATSVAKQTITGLFDMSSMIILAVIVCLSLVALVIVKSK
jgi:hypothetical protein